MVEADELTIHESTPPGMSGELRVDPQIRGRSGELRQAREVLPEGSPDPQDFEDLFSESELEELSDRLLYDRNFSLTDLANRLPAEGAAQVELPTGLFARGGGVRRRIVDHIYRIGDEIILRESKNLERFTLTRDIIDEIQKDIDLLRLHPEAIVEWRIEVRQPVSDAVLAAFQDRTRAAGERFIWHISVTTEPI